MDHTAYYGHELQLFGVEELRLCGGRGDGMRIWQVRNGKGLEFQVLPDRGCDIGRLSVHGDNYSFVSVNGFVAPAYYDDKGDGWVKNFTAGFLTTCGLLAVGSPCVDEGEALPLHGALGNTPAEHVWWEMDEEEIRIHGMIRHVRIFAQKLVVHRTIHCSLKTNTLSVEDEIENLGSKTESLMILYHMNMGYPLLSETAELWIPAARVRPRNDRAAEDLDTWGTVLSPTANFEEQCYYHEYDGKPGVAGIYNPAIGKGLKIAFDSQSLDCFVQWKMMGEKDYVMGLEPGNCYPDGRDQMRAQNRLKFIAPGEKKHYGVTLTMVEGSDAWNTVKNG